MEDVVVNIYGNTYSKPSISRITTNFSELLTAWLDRQLLSDYVYRYHSYQCEKRLSVTEAFFVLLGLKEDVTREALSIINILKEFASGWEDILREIRARKVERVGLFVFDTLTGLGSFMRTVFTQSMQQKSLHFSAEST